LNPEQGVGAKVWEALAKKKTNSNPALPSCSWRKTFPANPKETGQESMTETWRHRQYGIKSPYRIAWNESAPELRGSARWSGSFGPRAETGPGGAQFAAGQSQPSKPMM